MAKPRTFKTVGGYLRAADEDHDLQAAARRQRRPQGRRQGGRRHIINHMLPQHGVYRYPSTSTRS